MIFTGLMASLYQRFTGKINTNKSFPHPPEASHLLGGQVPEEDNKGGKSPHHPSSRPPAQYRKRNACEDEDVRNRLYITFTHQTEMRACVLWSLVLVNWCNVFCYERERGKSYCIFLVKMI